MNLNLAVKTKAAINAAIEADQGASYRQWLGRVLPHIGDAYRGEEDGYRTHLGASLLGRECARELWYSFHWATKSHFDGRRLRLFNRGHLEEGRFIAMLLMIGVQVYQQDANGKQFRISEAGGHVGGSGDGVGVGLPDLAPGMPALLEFKTHNDKSFTKLVAEGVRNSKFEHFVQMNIYMRKMGLAVGMYGAVNKNTDEIHLEMVPMQADVGDSFLDRGRKIVMMRTAPDRLDATPKKPQGSPGWFGCAFCDHKPVCKLGSTAARNCRTCEWSNVEEDGSWTCTNKERRLDMVFGPQPGVSEPGETFLLTKERQLIGCNHYVASSQL